jgi:hypothetical protein
MGIRAKLPPKNGQDAGVELMRPGAVPIDTQLWLSGLMKMHFLHWVDQWLVHLAIG